MRAGRSEASSTPITPSSPGSRSWFLKLSSSVGSSVVYAADDVSIGSSFLWNSNPCSGGAGRSVSAVLLREPLRPSRYYWRRHAQPGSYDGDCSGVVVVHTPEGWMRIITERALHAPRGLLIGQPRCQMQRHVDPRRYTRRADELAVLDPPLANVLHPKLLHDLVVDPVGGCLPTLKQPDGGQDERPRADRPGHLGGFGCRTHVAPERLVAHGLERRRAVARHEQDGRVGYLLKGVGGDQLHV